GAHGPLHFARARSLLSRYGIRFCRDGFANSVDEAIAVADGLGYPVVLKTARPDVMHKTEVGAVVTHLRSRDDVRDAAQRLAALAGCRPRVRSQRRRRWWRWRCWSRRSRV